MHCRFNAALNVLSSKFQPEIIHLVELMRKCFIKRKCQAFHFLENKVSFNKKIYLVLKFRRKKEYLKSCVLNKIYRKINTFLFGLYNTYFSIFQILFCITKELEHVFWSNKKIVIIRLWNIKIAGINVVIKIMIIQQINFINLLIYLF